MKQISLLSVLSLFLFFSACHLKTAPELGGVSESIDQSEITLGGILAENIYRQHIEGYLFSKNSTVLSASVQDLGKQFQQDGKENLSDDFMEAWRKLQKVVAENFENLSENDLVEWTTLNDALLKHSAMVCFADELERIFYNSQIPAVMNDSMIKSVCYTRRYDRIYVNLYTNSTLDFEHTTGGHVRLIQDTDYPNDGKITLKFEVEDKRYVDLFIRIPEWTEIASVTARGVKYPVHPGEYTEVATKWKSGDRVEVVLGMNPKMIQKENDEFGFSFGSLYMSYEPDSLEIVARRADRMSQLQMVSPPGKMPTFIYSGIPDRTLVLQPFYAEGNGYKRTIWIKQAR